MALAAGMGEEGSVKAAAGAAERSQQSGEPLQVPTGYAKKPPEAGVRDKGKKLWPIYLRGLCTHALLPGVVWQGTSLP